MKKSKHSLITLPVTRSVEINLQRSLPVKTETIKAKRRKEREKRKSDHFL
jgi:hypothetical protein